MSSEDKPRKNPDQKDPSKEKDHLTDEQLDQVSGGSEQLFKTSTEQAKKQVK